MIWMQKYKKHLNITTYIGLFLKNLRKHLALSSFFLTFVSVKYLRASDWNALGKANLKDTLYG